MTTTEQALTEQISTEENVTNTLRMKTVIQIAENGYKGLQKLPDDIIHDVIMYTQWKAILIISDLYSHDDDPFDCSIWQYIIGDMTYNYIRNKSEADYNYVSNMLEWVFPMITTCLVDADDVHIPYNDFHIYDIAWAINTKNEKIIDIIIKNSIIQKMSYLQVIVFVIRLLDKNIKYAELFINTHNKYINTMVIPINTDDSHGNIDDKSLCGDEFISLRHYDDIIEDGYNTLINKCKKDQTLILMISSNRTILGFDDQ